VSDLSPNYDASIDFLRKFHPNGRRWVVTAISTDKKQVETRTFDASREVDALRWLEEHGKSRNIYFSVAEIDRDVNKKAERADIVRVHYLHVDIDPRAGEDIGEEQSRALRLLAKPPGNLPPPTWVVFSGGGYQAFWALRDPINIDCDLAKAEDAKRWNLQIETLYDADNVHNVDRIMRLPGTINRPDPVKVRKGRTAALSRVEAHHPDRIYSLGEFTKAPEVQAGGGGGLSSATHQVRVSGNVRRLNDVTELDRLSDTCKVVIVQGHDPDDPNRWPGRSEALYWVVCEMVRQKYSDDEIYSVITDHEFGISESVLDKGSQIEKYALRQISRAREDAINPWLGKLNEKHAIISDWGGKCRVVQEQYDEVMGRSRLTKQSFEDFSNRYMNHKIVVGTNKEDNPITKPVGRWWLENEHRRQYEKIIFAPGKEVPDAYNLWRGFACDARPGDCSLFLAHLRDNVCRGNDDYHAYLVRWMARAVQKPDSPGYAAVVMRGGQGTGKSFVAKTFGSLFGRHYMQVTDPKHLVGSFNAHLRDCVVLFGDEAFYAGDKKHESILKMLVTEEVITVEAKGVDAEASANCVHLLLASNEQWVVPVASDDRRFFVLNVGDARKRDNAYFASISDQMNAGGREALLHYLLTLDLSGFDVRDVPKTDEHKIQKSLSMSPEDQWITDIAEHGVLASSLSDRPNVAYSNSTGLYCDGLYQHARQTVPALRSASDKTLGHLLKRWGAVNWNSGAQRGWEFPPLPTFRAAWEQKYGKREWPGGADAQWANSVNPEYAAFGGRLDGVL
jgi:hypothetical protein